MRKGILVTLVLTGLLLGAGVGVYMGVPYLAERFAGRVLLKMADYFGREVRVGALKFHRYDRLELTDVIVKRPGAPDDEPPLFQAEHVDIRFDPESLLSGKARLTTVDIRSPRLGVVRYKDGTDNYRDVVAKIRKILNRKKKGEGSGDGPFKYLARAMPELKVEGARVRFADLTGHSPVPGFPVVELEGGTFSARDESPVTEKMRLVFEGNIGVPQVNNGIRFSGHFQYPERTYDLAVSLDRRLEHNFAGRDLSIGGLSWEMGGRFRLTDVTVGAAPGSDEAKTGAPALRIKSVDLTLADADAVAEAAQSGLPATNGGIKGRIGRMLKRIQKVTLVEPELFVARYANQRTNFADLAEQLAAAPVNVPGQEGQGGGSADEQRKARLEAQESERTRSRERRQKVPGEGFRLAVSGFLGSIESGFRRLSDVVYLVGARLPVPEVAIQGGTLRYADEVLFDDGFQSELRNFDLTAKRLPNEPVMTFDVRFETGDKALGAANHVTGRVHLLTRDVQVGVAIDRLGLLPYRALFPSAVPVDEGTVVHHTDVQFIYSHEREEMEIEGGVQVDGLQFFHPLVASETLTNMNVGASFTARMDFAGRKLAIDKSVLAIGGARFKATGTVERYDTYPQIDVKLRMPKTSVQVIADSLPLELVPMLEGLRVSGTLLYSLDVKLDTKDIATLDYESDYRLDDFFVVDLGRRLNFDLLKGRFIHRVHEPDGTIREFATGPGARDWVPYPAISPFMTAIITTTEDGSFFRHSGFSPFQIKKSIITNLQKGGFYRGASTISQQLVKNLFLSREKTMSRKLQELFITWQLEKTLTKEEILELYFNVIELGPGIYGIGPAAGHYFGKRPSELTLLDCAFLASIIPNPKKYHKQFEGGHVTEGWRKKLEYYLRKMVEQGKITELEFALSRPFSPVFIGQEAPPPPSELLGIDGKPLQRGEDGDLEPPAVFDPTDDSPEGGEPPVIEFAPAPTPLPTKPSLKPRSAQMEP